MRLRLTLYGFASLVLLAVYEPAKAAGTVLLDLRERLVALCNSAGFSL